MVDGVHGIIKTVIHLSLGVLFVLGLVNVTQAIQEDKSHESYNFIPLVIVLPSETQWLKSTVATGGLTSSTIMTSLVPGSLDPSKTRDFSNIMLTVSNSGGSVLPISAVTQKLGESAKRNTSNIVQYLEKTSSGEYSQKETEPAESPGLNVEVTARLKPSENGSDSGTMPTSEPVFIVDTKITIKLLKTRAKEPGQDTPVGKPGLFTKEVTGSREFPQGQWQLMAALSSTDVSKKHNDTILVLGFFELVERSGKFNKAPPVTPGLSGGKK